MHNQTWRCFKPRSWLPCGLQTARCGDTLSSPKRKETLVQEMLSQIQLPLGFVLEFYSLKWERHIWAFLTAVWCTLDTFVWKLCFGQFSPELHPVDRLMLMSRCLSTGTKTCRLQVFSGKSQYKLQIEMERAVLTFFLVHCQWGFCISISWSNIFNIFFFFFLFLPYVWNFSRLLCKTVLCLSVTGETAVRPNEEC